MELFNEIYGNYYLITAKALEKGIISDKEIGALIGEYGTDETRIGLSQMLIPAKDPSRSEDLGFFERQPDGRLKSIFRFKPVQILTALEKRWLKTKLSDRRIRLFLSSETIMELDKALENVRPLYPEGLFRCYDRFSDGDDFSDPHYQEVFRGCLKACKENYPLTVRFTSGHGNSITALVQPLKLEYSCKNDKFRLYCRRLNHLRKGKNLPYITINIGRIEYARPAKEMSFTGAGNDQPESFEPETENIVIRVTNERNSVERFMLAFASYEKNTVRAPDSGECEVTMKCPKNDETEVLIRLLSFGPTLEIMSPAHFRAQAAERVRRQYERFFGSPDDQA